MSESTAQDPILTPLQRAAAVLAVIAACLLTAVLLLGADGRNAQQAFNIRGEHLTRTLVDRLTAEQALLTTTAA